ncbi:MAG: hypothetical protein ACLPWD_04825 [Methanobacterium sp.]
MITTKTLEQQDKQIINVYNTPSKISFRHISIVLPTGYFSASTNFILNLDDGIPKKIRISNLALIFPYNDTNANFPYNVQLPGLNDSFNINGNLTIMPAYNLPYINNAFDFEWSNFRQVSNTQQIIVSPTYLTGTITTINPNSILTMNIHFYY